MISSCNTVLLCALFKFVKGKSCFLFLKRRLPANITKALDRFVQLRCKIGKENFRITFLRYCRLTQSFPKDYFHTLCCGHLKPTVMDLQRLNDSYIEASLAQYVETQLRFSPILEQLSLLSHIKVTNFCSDAVKRAKLVEMARLEFSVSEVAQDDE